jgi:hypothetical protein
MPKITYIEHNGKSHVVEVPNGLSIRRELYKIILQESMLIVEVLVPAQRVMFMLMINGLINYQKKKMQNKICLIWLLSQTNSVDWVVKLRLLIT